MKYLVSLNMTWIDHPVCGIAVPRFCFVDENIKFLSENMYQEFQYISLQRMLSF